MKIIFTQEITKRLAWTQYLCVIAERANQKYLDKIYNSNSVQFEEVILFLKLCKFYLKYSF